MKKKKRQLNTKLLAALFFGTLLVGAGAFAAHQYMTVRSAETIIKRAKGAAEQAKKDSDAKKLQEAFESYQRYLAIKPADVEAMKEYGFLLDDAGLSADVRVRAMPVFQKVLVREPGNDEVRKALVTLILETARPDQPGAFVTAQRHLERLIEAEARKAQPDNIELARLYDQLGRVYEGQKKYEASASASPAGAGDLKRYGASEAYAKSIELDPKQAETYLRRAFVLQNLGRGAEAEKLMDEAVAKNPDDPLAYRARCRYARMYRLKTDGADALASARADAAKALELAKTAKPQERAEALLEAALVETTAPVGGDLAKARRWLAEGREVFADSPLMYALGAYLERRAGDGAAAETILNQAVRQFPDLHNLRWQLADLLIDNGKHAQAEKLIEALRALPQVPAPTVDLLRGCLQSARGQWQQAERTIMAVRPAFDRPEWRSYAVRADLELARCYWALRGGREDEAAGVAAVSGVGEKNVQIAAYRDKEIAAYQRVLRVEPGNELARVRLALAQMRRDPAEAMETLRQLKDGTDRVRLMEAHVFFMQLLAQPPEKRDWTELDRRLDAIDAKTPAAARALLLTRVEADLTRGQADSARARLRAAREKDQKDVDLWVASASLDQRLGRPGEAMAVLDEADRALGKDPKLLAARVELWSRRDPAQALQALHRLAETLDLYPEDRRDDATEVVALGLANVGGAAKALTLIKPLAKQRRDDMRAQASFFDVALAASDDDAMAQAVEAVRRIEGDAGISWRFAEAGRLVAKARRDADKAQRDLDLKAAHKRLEEVRRDQPGWARPAVLEADIAEVRGDSDAAIEALTEAVRLGERGLNVVRRLVTLLYQRKRYLEADQAVGLIAQQIEQRGEENDAGDLRRQVAEIALRTRDPQEAVRQARAAVPEGSTNYADYVWLGQVYTAVDQPEEAEAAYRKAAELAPTVPEAWLALVQFQIRLKRNADAEQTLERARAALQPVGMAVLTLARGYELIGRNDRAEELFQQALAARPDDPATQRSAASYYTGLLRFDAAEPLLRKLIAPGAKTADADRLWARRALAYGLIQTGDPKRLQEAADLIEANQREAPNSLDEKRAKALVLAARPGGGAEAAKALDEIKGSLSGSADAEDLLTMARLFETAGRWESAKELLRKLAADNPDQGQPLVAYIQGLLRHDEFDEFTRQMDRLEQLKPDPRLVLALKASALKKQDRVEEALKLVRAFATEHPQQGADAAALLERVGGPVPAEELFKQRASSGRPEDLLPLAAFYGRQDRLKEALDACDAARAAKADINQVLFTAFSALAGSDASAEDSARVESWIDEAERTDGRKDALRNQRALLWAVAGRYKDAEALYRKVVTENPSDALALNNLAWVLALTGGDADEALKLVDRAIGVLGRNASTLDTRAVVNLARKHPDQAVRDLNHAVGQRPDPVLYFHLSRAYRAAGNRPAAVEALQTAEALGLKASDVDPLERPHYDEVVADLRKDVDARKQDGGAEGEKKN